MQVVWSKWIAPEQESHWLAVFSEFDAERWCLTQFAGRKRLKLSFFCGSEEEAENFRGALGGEIVRVREEDWHHPGAQKPTLIKVRGRLIVGSEKRELLVAQFPHLPCLSVPHELAFGTGEHATTGMCLRMLADFAPRGQWSMLDLGSGTGLLGMAARVFGASQVDAWDNDPKAVEVAAKNVRENGFPEGSIRVKQADALDWRPKRAQWDCIAANLFSSILAQVFPALRLALRPEGRLIISGILASQAEECLEAGRAAGFSFTRVRRRGKWVAAHT